MKKLVLTSLLAAFAVSSANAATNYFVGGSTALGFDKSHSNIVSIAPELGMKISEKWDLGVMAEFAYDHKYIGDEKAYDYGFGAFARYHAAQFGNFSLLFKGTVGAEFFRFDGDTEQELSASIIPMVTYDLTESFTLYANLNFLGVYAGYNFDSKDWGFGAVADSDNVLNTKDFQIGFTYNF